MAARLQANRRALIAAALPLFWFAVLLRAAGGQGVLAFDAHHGFWPAARAVLEGRSPYGPVTHATIKEGSAFIYPPAGALALMPLGLLPHTASDVLMTVAVVGAMLATPWLLGVRDWRCYAALSLWYPFYTSFQNANVSALLALGAAFAWTRRDRTWAPALAAGALVAVKVFLWPLLVWLAFTRRRTAARATVAAAGFSLLGLAVLGPSEAGRFVSAARAADRVAASAAYSPRNLLDSAGVPSALTRVLIYALGAGLIAAIALLARGRDGDRRAFVVAIAAALALSPVVWQHYFVLLAVPIAIARPRLAPAWVIPLVLWLTPQEEGPIAVWRIALALAAAGVVLALCLRPADRGPPVTAGSWAGFSRGRRAASARLCDPARAAS